MTDADQLSDEVPEGDAASDGPSDVQLALPSTDGYLLGAESGVALIQTTRVESPTHQGWVDITLDLVLASFQADLAFEPHAAAGPDGSICFGNVTEANDCFSVRWGSTEQFTAVLLPHQGSGTTWPVQKTWPMAVSFEVPANASRASFIYGEHRVPLDLQGDDPIDLADHKPATSVPAPIGADDPSWASGYFLGKEYGLAVTGVRRVPHASEPTWSEIQLQLAVMTFREGPELDLPIEFQTSDRSVCFGGDCIRVLWGGVEQFDAVLRSDQAPSSVLWPRSKAWPTTVKFSVPLNVLKGALVFGEHVFFLDLRGEVGKAPAWDYATRYRSLTGLTLHDAELQSIDLIAIDHDATTGDIRLLFEAVNRSGHTDFYPRITAQAARVSESGDVFDGAEIPRNGWRPVVIQAKVDPLAPGQQQRFEVLLPRVEGSGFTEVLFSVGGPDAMLLQLVADNNVAGNPSPPEGAVRFQPYYVRFDKTDAKAEATFFYPDLALTSVAMDPALPTAGETATLSFTIENLGPRNAPAASLAFSVDGEVVSTLSVPAIPAAGIATVETTWVTGVSSAVLAATVDPDDLVTEADTANNARSMTFAGGSLPDLVMAGVEMIVESTGGGLAPQFAVTVTNQGVGYSLPFRIAAHLNGGSSVEFFMSFPGLGSGDSATRLFPWTASLGGGPLELVADGFGDVVEEDELNNAGWAILPDLRFTHRVLVSTAPDDLIDVQLEVANAGLGDSPETWVSVWTDDAETVTRVLTIEPLAAGETVVLRFPNAPGNGRHQFRAVIDYGEAIPETDETNNEIAFSYATGPLADLTVMSTDANRSTLIAGEVVTLTIVVANLGVVTSEATTASLYANGFVASIGSVPIPSLVPGETTSINAEWTATAESPALKSSWIRAIWYRKPTNPTTTRL